MTLNDIFRNLNEIIFILFIIVFYKYINLYSYENKK